MRESRRAPWLAVGVVCFGAFMGQLDASIVTVAPANNTVTMRGAADSAASLLGGLVNTAGGIGTTLGISLMALALHLSSGAGAPHGYAGSMQGQPAFIVLAVVSAAAAAIALASRVRTRGQTGRPREADPSGVFS